MKRKTKLPSADTTPTAKLTHAQIEAMVKENRWWPFTRVPPRILPRMHLAKEKEMINHYDEAPL